MEILTRLYLSLFCCAEVCLKAWRDSTQTTVNESISSYLRHAPEKEGCPRYKVSDLKYRQTFKKLFRG